MKLLVLIVLALIAVAATADARTWTSVRGSTIEAELDRVEGDVAILRAGEKVFRIRIADLSEADQSFLRSTQAPAAPSVATPSKLGGVEVASGRRTVFKTPLTDEQRRATREDGNPEAAEATVAIALPPDFDPRGSNRFLVISSTSDGDGSSVNHHNEYWQTAIARGWVCIAADGPEKPPTDNNSWRWAMIRAAMDEIARAWPASTNWPVAVAGYSGGAKRSGYMAALFAKSDRRVLGMFMGGCNDDMASKGLNEFKPRRNAFLRVPIFLSAGDTDTTAPVSSVERVRGWMDGNGFKTIRLEIHQGGHFLYKPHVEMALDWFAAEAATAKE